MIQVLGASKALSVLSTNMGSKLPKYAYTRWQICVFKKDTKGVTYKRRKCVLLS
jgi:hypothetical protein